MTMTMTRIHLSIVLPLWKTFESWMVVLAYGVAVRGSDSDRHPSFGVVDDGGNCYCGV